MSIIRQGTLPVGSLDHAITLNVQSGESHFETVTDTTPYLYRTSPQDVASSMKLQQLVGGTIAWNQFVQNGNFASDTLWVNETGTTHTISNGVLTLTTETANNGVRQIGFACVSGHKYLVYAEGKCEETKKVAVGSGSNYGVIVEKDVGSAWTVISKVVACVASSNNTPLYIFGRNTTLTNAQIRNFNIFDLTQMFGSTIADYIYSLEQAHAGDGVAWFKALFPNDYYAYDSGTLMSVQTSEHKMVGFNQWDEEWEVGGLTSTGVPTSGLNRIRSKNYCPILPNTTYFGTCGKTDGGNQNRYYIAVYFYDSDKEFISYAWTNNITFTTPSNAAYFKITTNSSTVVYGNTYNHDICINLSSSRNGEYEPYEEHTYPLDDNLTLRGIPKLDSNNELYYDGDIYTSDGTVTRKYGTVTFDGSSDESWIVVAYGTDGNYRAYTSVNGIATTTPDTSIGNVICNKFTPMSYSKGATQTGVTCRSGYAQLNFFQTAITSVNDWKTWLSNNPVTVVYELATPTTESADSYTQAQRVGATEEFVDARSVPIPVGNESEYKRLIQGE